MRTPSLALGLSLLVAAPLSSADTVLEMTVPGPAQQLKSQKVFIKGSMARTETGRPDYYMLMDLDNKHMYGVNTTSKQIVDMSQKPKNAQIPEPKEADTKENNGVTLVKKEGGKTVAGYETVQYQVMAQGKACGFEYVSAKAQKLKELNTFVQTMQDMQRKRMKSLAAMPFIQQDPCVLASAQASLNLADLGLSLRSEDAQGKVRREVVSIQSDAKLPEDTFKLPADYERLTPMEMMQRSLKGAVQTPGNGAAAAPAPSPEERQKLHEALMKRLQAARQQAEQSGQQNAAPKTPFLVPPPPPPAQ